MPTHDGADHVSRALASLANGARCETSSDAEEEGGAWRAAESELLQSMRFFDSTPFDEMEAMVRAFREGMPTVFEYVYDSWVRGGALGDDALAYEVFYPAVAFSRLCQEVPCPESLDSTLAVFDFLLANMRAGVRVPADCVFTEAHSEWQSTTSDPAEYKRLVTSRLNVLVFLKETDLAKFTARHMYLAMKNLDFTGIKFLHEVMGLPLDDANADEHFGRAIRARDVDAFEYFLQHHLGASSRTYESMKECFLKNVSEALEDEDVPPYDDSWGIMGVRICSIPQDHTETKTTIRALGELVDAHKSDMPEGAYVGVMRFLQNSFNSLDDDFATLQATRLLALRHEFGAIFGIAPPQAPHYVFHYDGPFP